MHMSVCTCMYLCMCVYVSALASQASVETDVVEQKDLESWLRNEGVPQPLSHLRLDCVIEEIRCKGKLCGSVSSPAHFKLKYCVETKTRNQKEIWYCTVGSFLYPGSGQGTPLPMCLHLQLSVTL